jgi:hypothetical protein
MRRCFRRKTFALNAVFGLQQLTAAITRDMPVSFVPYGTTFLPADLPDIPQEDLPAGSPPWMCGNADWAKRTGVDDQMKRVTITITIPKAFRPV